MLRFAVIAVLLSTVPALASTDREEAVSTLAGFYNSAGACELSISRAKVDAYADAARPKGDTLFNIDVWKATTALDAEQKDWTDAQLKEYCTKAAATARSLGVTLP